MISKKTKILIILTLILEGLLSILLGIKGVKQYLRYKKLTYEIQKMNLEYEKLNKEHYSLLNEIQNLNKDSYIEKEMKEKMNFLKPGEKMVVIVKEEVSSDKQELKKDKGFIKKFLEIIR